MISEREIVKLVHTKCGTEIRDSRDLGIYFKIFVCHFLGTLYGSLKVLGEFSQKISQKDSSGFWRTCAEKSQKS